MGFEVEKKYRLTREQAERVRARLRAAGATARGAEFEENTLYSGAGLDPQRNALRLRRAGARATLAYKERDPTPAAIKRHREEETSIENPAALAAILEALGYAPALVYEKRRETWALGGAEIMIDELPFGTFLEIEGDEQVILEIEEQLNLSGAPAEHSTYPHLTALHGARRGAVIESRFQG